jgi:probable phosphoglycerate mutase
MKVYAVSHGQTFLNTTGRVQGSKCNPTLTVTGKEQANKAAELLSSRGIDIIIASPLKRSMETAEIIARRLNIDKRQISEATKLNERDFGDYENKSVSEVDLEALSRWTDNVPTPRGETIREVANRIVGFMDITLELFHGKTLLLVVHDQVLRALYWYFHGIPKPGEETHIETENCTLYEFDTMIGAEEGYDYEPAAVDIELQLLESALEPYVPDVIVIPDTLLAADDANTGRVLGQNEIDDLIKSIFAASAG